MAEKKNGNGKGRGTNWVIEGFGKVVVAVRLYSTAKDKDDRAQFNQYHGHDAGKVRYKKVCEICGEELPAESIVKGKMIGDKLIPFTEEELDAIKKDKNGKIIVKSFRPAKDFTPNMLGKSMYVGTAKEGGAQPFKLLHDVMRERQGMVAEVAWVDRGHDHRAVLSVFDDGFLLQEITPKYLYKDFSQVAIEKAEIPAKLVEKGVGILDGMIDKKPFNHDAVIDEYAETVSKITGLKAMGEEIPIADLPQKKAEMTDLEAMLDAS